MRKGKGCLRSCVVAAAALLAVVLLAYASFAVYASMKLAAKVRSLEAQGVKLRLPDLAPPTPPPERNAALVYVAAFDALRESAGDITTLSAIPKGTASPAEVATARAIVQRAGRSLTLVGSATHMPECAFPVDWSRGVAALFPHLPKLRGLARLLSAAAVLSAKDGRHAAATEYCVECLGVADATSREPAMLAQLVRYAIQAMAVRALGQVTKAPSALTLDECRRIADRLAATDLSGGFALGLQGDRAAIVTTCELARRDGSAFLRGMGITTAPVPLRLGLTPPFRPLQRLEEASFLDAYDGYAERVSRPWREISGQHADLTVDSPPFPGLLSPIISPLSPLTDSHGLARRRDATAASLGLAEVALGLQAWKATHGAYPARLDQLRSGMQWPVPLDPFSGQEYVYRAQGEQYVLYSVGVNLKDDGGSGRKDEQEWPEDIVWGQ